MMKNDDFRIICSCQAHARRSVWRRGARIASRAAAVLIGVPIALAAFDLPTWAMNIDLSSIKQIDLAAAGPKAQPQAKAAVASTAPASNQLPIFTTPSVKEQFLTPRLRAMTIDVFKEEYFRKNVPYGSIIYREAVKNDLAPELVAAMVHTESDFRAQLVSNKSAQGLMQIIPETARHLGIEDPFNPQQNIAAGTKYFRYLLNRFNDPAVALAAYNAGEGTVERCRCIPAFPETRNYIERVNRRTHRYRQRVHTTYLAEMSPAPAAE
jgi:soluble lytic murein transglycosylase-like protein